MTSLIEKEENVKKAVEKLFADKPDWIAFYREVLGLSGLVRQSFATPEALAEFEQTDAYQEIQRMLTKLRRRGPAAAPPEEPTRVITVRIPKSLHEALSTEAHEHSTSINKLCISKLLQFIDHAKVPTHAPRRVRTRR